MIKLYFVGLIVFLAFGLAVCVTEDKGIDGIAASVVVALIWPVSFLAAIFITINVK